MNSLISPKPLQKGDKVGIVALASKLNFEDILPAIDILEKQWGLKVVVGNSVKSAHFNFAGTDEVRANDFQQMLDDESIKAIFSARGGYGSSRFIDRIDFTKFQQSPKWVIGFSDITAVHCQIQTLGFQSLHAPMPKTFFKDLKSLEYLRQLLFGESLQYNVDSHEMNRLGRAEGQIIGGNLCLLAHLIGSVSDLDTTGKILFIEDIGEYLYNIDRMMVQMKRAEKFKNLAGLVVGDFSDIRENDEPFGKTAYEIIAEHTADYNFPIAFGFPIGHEAVNYPVACGRFSTLKVTNINTTLEM